MKRYKINMTSLQWSTVALDLSRKVDMEPACSALVNLIRIALEYADNPEDTDLPFNVEEV